MDDWNEVIIHKRSNNPKSSKEVNNAFRKGISVETTRKYAAGTNKQHANDKNTHKMSEDMEHFDHETVSLSVGIIIQRARQQKQITQKELATKINEKPQVISEYEQGKAIPNQQILLKMERILGVKLRGKDKGQSLSTVPKK